MLSRHVPAAVAAAIVLIALVGGVVIGSAGLIGVRVPASVGDGIVGEQVATLWVGDTAFGAKSSVAWRDASGAQHKDGWPACVSTPGEVKGIRFTGATVWHDNVGMGTILWVDCAGH